jgi:hypothetical protein
MDNAKFLIENHSSTTFFADILIFVLSLHVFAREDALLEFKADAVLTKQFGKQLAFNLLNKLINSVTKGEIALVGWMGVKVQIHKQSLLFTVVFAELLYGIAGRLLLRVRISVVSI